MEPLPIPKNLTVYMLLKQNGLYFYPTGNVGTGSPGMSCGFYATRAEAEMQRTGQALQSKPDSNDKFLIFELEIPNPAYSQ
jgi:hypothetical protein